MSTTAVSTSPEPVPPVPHADEVFAFAAREVAAAAADLWPRADVDLGDHVPSVTGYVRRIRVDGRALYAKYAFLGVSLVSLLRGACGPWPDVREAQQAYVRRPGSLMDREAAQLRLLAQLGSPRVCPVAGLARGVLFTESVTGSTLADLLLQRPHDATDLLAGTFGELRVLRHPSAARLLGPARVIGERSIRGTFQRKFNGLSGPTYVERLGAERCASADRILVVGLLRDVVVRLHRLQATGLPQQTSRRVLAYGDLKPEHVVFPEGTSGHPVFIDPGLLLAPPAVDAAKLISRTVLLLAAARPGTATGRQTMHGLGAFAALQAAILAGRNHCSWMRELLVLWLMDSVNILTTYLSAPGALPLPGRGSALIGRAVGLGRMADQLSSELAAGTDVRIVWESALGLAEAVAA
ncbi:phosphotransferase [Streptomyces rishiriensis]|uniref:phosphotransferase n=1 Tax=Streptomyces rishiriensis TaxID=68264 RepID=UPI001FE27262|nr:phosphotransferase [Streptomyces rishiriensis]